MTSLQHHMERTGTAEHDGEGGGGGGYEDFWDWWWGRVDGGGASPRYLNLLSTSLMLRGEQLVADVNKPDGSFLEMYRQIKGRISHYPKRSSVTLSRAISTNPLPPRQIPQQHQRS